MRSNAGLMLARRHRRRSSITPALGQHCENQTGPMGWIITLEAPKYFYINQKTKAFFQFDIIINVLVSSFWFIWILCHWSPIFINMLGRTCTRFSSVGDVLWHSLSSQCRQNTAEEISKQLLSNNKYNWERLHGGWGAKQYSAQIFLHKPIIFITWNVEISINVLLSSFS